MQVDRKFPVHQGRKDISDFFLVYDPLCPETSCCCSVLALQGTAYTAAEHLESKCELLTWFVGIWAGQ